MFWPKKSKKAADPVCLMKVKVEDGAVSLGHKGQRYYFCSENCKGQFKQNPQKYLS
ncbi:MAG: YHS domain-containing protein [Candidatus Curtissbacteria bacterium]|nr:YHS domain-containing protein [Candidatus Curtissbacteria bacterium]